MVGENETRARPSRVFARGRKSRRFQGGRENGKYVQEKRTRCHSWCSSEKMKNELSRARARGDSTRCFPFCSTRLNWLLLDVVPANVRRRLAEETGASWKKNIQHRGYLNDEIRAGNCRLYLVNLPVRNPRRARQIELVPRYIFFPYFSYFSFFFLFTIFLF